ncbi:SDR family NAD(P)-dependent oxidoreductase [Rugamonas sp.]|uniref:SDR family NAD(P)-dependent oxidoreductase n=1 Tax=Rugamonas sp. TaxID=1926287 RepID=UPI0025E70F23|nr:SDR family NAD(P)-dependent oxidoreductase [Rugamonas sp.]
MNINGSIALVTGAHGGIGRAFVAQLLTQGAAKVYVTARDRASLAELIEGGDPRLVPLVLDVTNADQVAQAAIAAPDVTLLINNAGYAAFQGAIAAPTLDDARREMEVNYFGPLALTRAFQPVLQAAGGGAIVNLLSMAALVSLPVMGTYSASKAAFLSVTRSIRAELAAQGTIVVGVLAVQTASAIGNRLPEPRMTPDEVVIDTLATIEAGKSEEIAAGSLTQGAYQAFSADPIAFQAKMSTRLPKPA